MKIDEKRENVLTNYNAVRVAGKITESDHNNCELEVNLFFSSAKQECIEIFQFKNLESQKLFKNLTTETNDFTDCFKNNLDFDVQARNWKKVLDNYFHKSWTTSKCLTQNVCLRV